jgi:predicted nucleic acid-binding protein
MMVYADTSAIIKKYVDEPGSNEVRDLILRTPVIATCVVSRAEAAAAFARAARIGSLSPPDAEACHKLFSREWKHFARIRVTEALIARADVLAWTFKLRGYDAVHLAAALNWSERLAETVTVATFDRELWDAATETELHVFPARL